MNKRTLLIVGIVALILLTGLGVGVFLTQGPQLIQKRATQGDMCTLFDAVCRWTGSTGTTSYKVDIVDTTDNVVIYSQTTADTEVSFAAEPNHTYTCTVVPSNACGTGPAGEASNTCIPGATPTPTDTPSPTVTVTPTVTVSPTPVICTTPNQCLPQSQCANEGRSESTDMCSVAGEVCCMPPGVTPTVTPTVTVAPTNSPTATPTSTRTPTPGPCDEPNQCIPGSTCFAEGRYEVVADCSAEPVGYVCCTPPGAPSRTPTPTVTTKPTATPHATQTPAASGTPKATQTPTPVNVAVASTSTPVPVPEVPTAGGFVPTILGIAGGTLVILLMLML